MKCPKCNQFVMEHAALLFGTFFLTLVVYIELKVFRKMLEEYFMLRSYLDNTTYVNCYKPQAEMRLLFELLCIYLAIIGVVLTGTPAFNFTNDWIKIILKKVINLSALIFGPLLFTFCLYGFKHFKELAAVCTLRGIKPNSDNFVNISLLFISCFVSISVSHSIIFFKKMELAEQSFGDENSILNKITTWYFNYSR